MMPEGNANSVSQIHHHAYACWDSEETRHFYEDVLGMPLVATIVHKDPLRTDGSMYCHTFFEVADGSVLAFFEHTSLFHPKNFAVRCGFHREVALEVQGNAAVRQLKCKLDAAGVRNVLRDNGTRLSLRCNDPNGLVLELRASSPTFLGYDSTSRTLAHAELQQWLYHRQNWWRSRRSQIGHPSDHKDDGPRKGQDRHLGG
jgi:glyoxylase I family protein